MWRRKEGRMSFSHSDFECYLRECKWIVAKMCKQRDRYARCCCGRRDPNLICGYIEERKSQSSWHDMNMLINNLLNSKDMLKGSSHQRVGDLRYVSRLISCYLKLKEHGTSHFISLLLLPWHFAADNRFWKSLNSSRREGRRTFRKKFLATAYPPFQPYLSKTKF